MLVFLVYSNFSGFFAQSVTYAELTANGHTMSELKENVRAKIYEYLKIPANETVPFKFVPQYRQEEP